MRSFPSCSVAVIAVFSFAFSACSSPSESGPLPHSGQDAAVDDASTDTGPVPEASPWDSGHDSQVGQDATQDVASDVVQDAPNDVSPDVIQDAGPQDAGPQDAGPQDAGPQAPQAGYDTRIPIDYAKIKSDSFFLPAQQHKVTEPACNSVSFTESWNDANILIGRALNNTDSNPCSGTTWSLHTMGIDWNAKAITKIKPVLTLPAVIEGGARTITTIYDPFVIPYGAERWLVGECHGQGFLQTVGACAGPLNKDNTLDLSRTRALVLGGTKTSGATQFDSASVPKLLPFNGKLYLYWTAVHIDQKHNPAFTRIVTRGIEVERDGHGRLQIAGGLPTPILADDAHAVEVMGTESDARSNTVADVFQVFSDGTYVYATAAVGGSGCVTPLGTSSGCYRLTLRRANKPLGTHIFNAERIPDDHMAPNRQEYGRVLRDGSGHLWLIDKLIAPMPNSGQLPGGLSMFALPSKSLSRICDAKTQPAPHWGVREGKCLKSCGNLGGTASYVDSCKFHNLADIGEAYDVPYCCGPK